MRQVRKHLPDGALDKPDEIFEGNSFFTVI